MIDYSKVSFNELNIDCYPLQCFFNYEVDIAIFLENYDEYKEVPENANIVEVELCLTVFARNDFKLEAVCMSDYGKQFWIELQEQFTNADGFISLIPDYGTIRLKKFT